MTDREAMQQAQLEKLEGTLWILNQELTRKQAEIDALRKLMQQALEALEEIADEVFSPYDSKLGEVILALRERLAQPEREKVAWVGLTEAERIDIIDEEITAQSTEHFALAQAIEAKLKEKNT